MDQEGIFYALGEDLNSNTIKFRVLFAQVSESGQLLGINGRGKVLCANLHPIYRPR